MILKCLGSGSSGNCYLLTDSNGKTLILDCGLSIREIKKGLNYDLRCVAGCIVTHHHKDHSKSAKELEEIGIEVYKPYEECYKAMNFKKAPFLISTVPMQDKDGKFCHTNTDGSECPCYGFIISHPEMGNLLYVTDTEFVKWRFRNLNHILVSCQLPKEVPKQSGRKTRTRFSRAHGTGNSQRFCNRKQFKHIAERHTVPYEQRIGRPQRMYARG